MRAQLERDFERFGRELPRDFPAHVRERYHIDLSARYLGFPLPHPIGKGSGQLSLHESQLEIDHQAGLAFVVLKTVIAQDASGAQTMKAWATHETKMEVERRRSGDREGWTVTWKGRGWDRSFDDYLALVRVARDLTRSGELVAVPSVKYHLPVLDEPFRDEEYQFTTGALARQWGAGPLPLEKDFSPTLAGDARSDEREAILRWLAEVPARIRAGGDVRLGVKLMNARFDDDFQRKMVEGTKGADALIVFNRLFDVEQGVAYGGWDLSDRNLRVLTPGISPGSGSDTPGLRRGSVNLVGTGNVCSGRMIAEYARCGCESVQLHTAFQLPLSAYPSTDGSRTQRVLHQMIFDPTDGLIAVLWEHEAAGRIGRHDGELRFLDLLHAHPQG